nr:immunoglobulin light chain junction region [Macaca mulatta]
DYYCAIRHSSAWVF